MNEAAKATRDGGGNLLHNMSAPSQTVIQRAAGQQRIGHGVVFELAASLSTDPADLLVTLGYARPDDRCEAEQRLRALIQMHAASLQLPAAAVIHDRVCSSDKVCSDLGSVLAVLSKSSGSVYLRDKEPNLNAFIPGKRVVVIIPPDWRPRS